MITNEAHSKSKSGSGSASASLRKIAALATCCLLIILAPKGTTLAQFNHNEEQQNAVRTEMTAPSPSKAAMLSATFPGLGQIYNGKYWKAPIIYAGFGTLAYFIDFNNREYRMWREAWIARIDGNPNTVDDFPFHSADVLERAMNYYRRNLEITYILSVALYLLNILDASVDAHLMNFDVGEDLSLGMQPITVPSVADASLSRQSAQITLRFRF